MKTYRAHGPEGEMRQVLASTQNGAAGYAASLFGCRMFEVIIYEETQP